ncbi:MAG: DNA repair protein RecO [Clostridia bacterium]|nr:DNA repair protein RecO [Clostridia bacterium]
METVSVKGLVVRTVNLSEADRLCEIYTDTLGLITASAKGARYLKSGKLSGTIQFCYSSFLLTKKGDRYAVKEVTPIESFFNLRSSLEGMALASYFCEILSTVGTADPEPELLRLTLNSLYAIAGTKYPLPIIKGAFEIRAMAMIGFMPEVLDCRVCGEKTGDFFFDIMDGTLICDECRNSLEAEDEFDDGHQAYIVAMLSEGAKIALGYCIFSPLEKLFSFRITEDDTDLFCRAAERYLVNHLERTFKTLEFYHEVSHT